MTGTFRRSAVELCDLPFSFWQLPLLPAGKFIDAARARDVFLRAGQLEALHRLRLLVPLLRVRRDGRALASAVRREDPWIWELARSVPTEPGGLREARDQGRLHDPAAEPFIARRRLKRRVGEVDYEASDYLYSHHQLLHLPEVRGMLGRIVPGPSGRIEGGRPFMFEATLRQARALREVVIACSALEPIHYPEIVLRTRTWGDELAEYQRWLKGQRGRATMRWLGVEPSWFRSRGEELLAIAARIDPMGRWHEVIREADPRSWQTLRGEARIAIDLRIGAEILLRHCERLAAARVPGARRLPRPRPGRRDPLAGRLKPTGKVNRVLTENGISPHPRLVFVVEGDTEELLLPRVYAHFKIRPDREFIAIENARGVGRDLSSLVAYAISPQVEIDKERRYLNLETPPTRLLAVMDAEGKYEGAAERERERCKLTERILLTFPREYRTPAVEEAIEGLITIETWNRRGESFEFAHFTDREIAIAIGEVYRPRKGSGREPSLKRRIAAVERLRERRGRLDEMLGAGSKVELAEALWPVLERKLRRAVKAGTERRIAVVRAIDTAGDLAHEYPRSNLVIGLRKGQANG